MGFLQEKYESKYKLIKDLPQYETERILREELKKTDVVIQWSSKVTEVTETVDSVTISVEGKEKINAKWLVGCDGGHSIVRKSMEISFKGEVSSSQLNFVLKKIVPKNLETKTPVNDGFNNLKRVT